MSITHNVKFIAKLTIHLGRNIINHSVSLRNEFQIPMGPIYFIEKSNGLYLLFIRDSLNWKVITMPIKSPKDLAALQKNPSAVRNICILAHVDHGEQCS